MRTVAIVLALAFALAFLEQLATAAAPLALTVRPDHFGFVGADVEIKPRILVEPERADRLLEIEATIDGLRAYYRLRSVDERISAQQSAWLLGPDAGHYLITARLLECSAPGCGKVRLIAMQQHEIDIRGRFEGGH